MYKVMQRYQVNNPSSIDDGKFLTIIKVNGDKVYFLYDGYSEICYFDIKDDFVYDLFLV